MVTLGLFLLYLIHLGSTETKKKTPNFETCIEADLKEIESLKEELFKELPLKETGNNKNLTSFGLLAEDWDRLHELENELPKDSIMKSRLLKAFRLLIAALYQAHLKQAYRQNVDKRNVTRKDISATTSAKCNKNIYNSTIGKYDLVDVETVNWPTSNQTINTNSTKGSVDNEVAGSDNEETEMAYPYASPSNSINDTTTPTQDISNVKMNNDENTFSDTSTYKTTLNYDSTISESNKQSKSNVEEFGITHLIKTTGALLASTPIQHEEYFSNPEGFPNKYETGIPSTFGDSFPTTESYNKSLEESHARNTTIYSINNDNTNSSDATEYYEESVENTPRFPFTINTGKPNLVPAYDDRDPKVIFDNFNSQDYSNGDSFESSTFPSSSSKSEIEEDTDGKGPYTVYQTTPHLEINSTTTYQKHPLDLGPSTNENTPDVAYENRILPDYDTTTNIPTIADSFSTTAKEMGDIQKYDKDYNSNGKLTLSTNVSDHFQPTTPSFIETSQDTKMPTSIKYIENTHSDNFENDVTTNVPIFSQTMEMPTDGFKESSSHINLTSNNVTPIPTAISIDLQNQNTSFTISFGKSGNTNSNSISEIIPTQGTQSLWPISSPKPSLPYYFDNSLYGDGYEHGSGDDNDNDDGDDFNLNSNKDASKKDFPDGQEIDLPESKGGSGYVGPKKGFRTTTKTTPTERFKQFTVTFKKLFEIHNDDVGTNKLNIYQKKDHAETRPLQSSFTSCRSGDQCVRIKNFEFPHFSSTDRNVHVQQNHANIRYFPYIKGSQMPNNVPNVNIEVPKIKYQHLPSFYGWR